MAYYINGQLIGGANTLPKMTMAEYLALPVSERPTYWECTDKDYDEISAEDVTYGSGTVKDALDNLGTTTNTLDKNVNILNYSSASNKYITPSDGYLWIRNASGQTGALVICNELLMIGGTQGSFALWVKKGTDVYVTGTANNANFRSFT